MKNLSFHYHPPMGFASSNTKQSIFDILSYLVIVLFFVAVFWTATVPWLYKHHNGYSAVNALTAGKHFDEEGFFACKFLPIHQPGKVYHLPDEYYTHYPPLSNLINGVLRKIGFNSLLAFRFPFIIAATLAVLCWFLFIRNVYGSMAAFFCISFLAIHPEFFWRSYTPYMFSLDQFYRFGTICVVSFLFAQGEKKKTYLYVLLWLIMFFQSINSFEYTIYLQLYVWLYAFLFKVREKKKLLWLLSAPALGLLLHFLQNAWALGGIPNAVNDLTQAYMHRTGLQKQIYIVKLIRSVKMFFWNFVKMTLGSEQPTNYPLLVGVIVSVFSFFRLKKLNEITPFWRYLLLFFICDIYWYIILPQHVLGHFHLTRTLLPTVTFFVGMLLYFNIKILKQHIASRNKSLILQSLIIVVLISWVYPVKARELHLTIKDSFATELREYKYRNLKKFLPENALCLTNFRNNGCYIRYYLDRRTYFLRSTAQIEPNIIRLGEKPFFDKDSIFFVSDDKITTPSDKQYLAKHGKIVVTYKEATIYKLRVP